MFSNFTWLSADQGGSAVVAADANKDAPLFYGWDSEMNLAFKQCGEDVSTRELSLPPIVEPDADDSALVSVKFPDGSDWQAIVANVAG